MCGSIASRSTGGKPDLVIGDSRVGGSISRWAKSGAIAYTFAGTA